MSPRTTGVVTMPTGSTYAVTSSIAELVPDWQITGSELGGEVWHSTASASDSLATVTLSLPTAFKHTTSLLLLLLLLQLLQHLRFVSHACDLSFLPPTHGA